MTILFFLETIFFIYFSLCTAYLSVFTIASFITSTEKKSKGTVSQKINQFAILIPAYKEDQVILGSSLSVLNQIYEKHSYDLFVIADQMKDQTLSNLERNGITIWFPEPGRSSKANALKSAANSLVRKYDYVVILDADNLVPSNYLSAINEYLNLHKCIAVQTHRQAKNLTTPIAMLDAAIEEMNNTIFRLGHIRLGLSSALIGSGMVFDYNWFKKNINQIHTTGEDKEFEEILLRQKIHIHYAESITFKDEKVEQADNLSNQRKRWIATQVMLVSKMYREIPRAIKTGNWDYLIKAFQSIILPRSILVGTIGVIFLLAITFNFSLCYKWGTLLAILVMTLYLAIPRQLKTPLFYKAIAQTPGFIFIMFLNLFKLKGASKNFIHTKHG
ncbi:MAG: glycosyltransferase [Phocaeicola sp.]